MTLSDFVHIIAFDYITQEMNVLKISANYVIKFLRYGFSRFRNKFIHFVTKVQVCRSNHF